MNNIKYIIFPDIHGRSFWIDVIEKYIGDENIVFIFLGDYIDSYEYEHLSKNEWKNFLDIVELKKKYPERIILLLGNHDIHYLTHYGRGSRWDYKNSKRNELFYKDNLNLFDMTFSTSINNINFLFSHAGVGRGWLEHNKKFFNMSISNDDIIKYEDLPNFNEYIHTNDEELLENFYKTLSNVSFYRYGSHQYGSMIWADVHEHKKEYNNISNVVQIFGHTQQEKDPINYNNKIYCLDCRKAFALCDDGIVYDLDDFTPVKTTTIKDNLDEYNFFI